MEEGDTETLVAYFCFVKWGWHPLQFVQLSYREKAMTVAFLERYLKEEKEKQDKLNRLGGRKFRRR